MGHPHMKLMLGSKVIEIELVDKQANFVTPESEINDFSNYPAILSILTASEMSVRCPTRGDVRQGT
jgi:hypothetical protein